MESKDKGVVILGNGKTLEDKTTLNKQNMEKAKTHGYVTRNFDGQVISYPRKYKFRNKYFSKKDLSFYLKRRWIYAEFDKIFI